MIDTQTFTSVQLQFQQGTADTTPKASGGWDEAFKWLLAWAVMLTILFLLNKTKFGHVAIYYGLWLLLVFLLVSQADWLKNALAPLQQPAPGDK